MDYYVVNILCNICLLLVIRQFMNDYFFAGNDRSNIYREFLSLVWLVGTFLVNLFIHIPVVNLLTNYLLMLFIACTYKGKNWKKMLVPLMISVTCAACDMLAYVLTIPFLGEDDFFYSYFLTVVLALILERVFGIIMRRRDYGIIGWNEMVLLAGFPIMAAVILYCVTAMQSGLYRTVACICLVCISVLSVDAYNRIVGVMDEKLKKSILEKEVDAYRYEIEIMRISARKEENIRHDLRHHLFALEGLAKQGEHDKICTYIDDLRKSFADYKQIVHTGEYETDSLINYLLNYAKDLGIDVSCDIIIPEDIDLSLCKFNIIVGNLLENAIEAASKSELKKILITMKFSSGILFLRIKNSFDGQINIKNGMVFGNRRLANHGIGLRSVQDLVAEQNGKLDVNVADGYFIVDGIIPLE